MLNHPTLLWELSSPEGLSAECRIHRTALGGYRLDLAGAAIPDGTRAADYSSALEACKAARAAWEFLVAQGWSAASPLAPPVLSIVAS